MFGKLKIPQECSALPTHINSCVGLYILEITTVCLLVTSIFFDITRCNCPQTHIHQQSNQPNWLCLQHKLSTFRLCDACWYQL